MTKNDFANFYKSKYESCITRLDKSFCQMLCGDTYLLKCEQPCIYYEMYFRLRDVENMVFDDCE